MKNISFREQIFLNYLYYKSFLMNILLILNSKVDISKNKNIFQLKEIILPTPVFVCNI